MSKNYTNAEVEAAVTKLVRASIRRPYGTLGNRELSTSFNDIQDAAAGVFILTPNAPFYVVSIGAKRANDFLLEEAVTVESLLDSVEAVDRRVKPIENLSPLVNARVALSTLEGAAASRTKGFNSIAQVPAYQRFIQNTDRFLGDSSANIRSGGEIAQTPQEARSSLPQLVRDLTEQHAELLRIVGLLAGSIEDFDSLNLGQAVASSVISNVREVLQKRIEELQGLSAAARNSIIREVTLDILAGRAAVTGFGSLATPTTFVILEGQGSAFTDATHPGNVATVVSDFLGPYPIVDPNIDLNVSIDGVATLTIPLQGSFVAQLTGVVAEPYTIYGTGNPPPVGFTDSDQLLLELPGFPDVNVVLTKGTGLSVETIVADINAAITTQPIVAEPAFLPDKFTGVVSLDATGSLSDMDFVFSPPEAGDWTVLPVAEGDKILVEDPTSANDGAIYVVDAGGITATTLTATQLSGPAPSDETSKAIRIGSPNRFVRIRISDGNELQSLQDRQLIRTGQIANSANTTLGLFDFQESRSRNTTAQQLVNGINTSSAAQVNGVARVTAEATFVSQETILGRSEPTNPLQITLFYWRGTASYTGGLNATFTLSSTIAGAESEIHIGDAVVLRTAAMLGEVDAVGSVSTIGTSTFTALFSSPITASSGELVEVGPASAPARDAVLRIVSESLNDGDYPAQDPSSVPLDIVLDRPLVAYRSFGGLPYFFEVEVGQFRIEISSTSTQIDSAISIDGPAASILFSTVPKAAVGSTPFLKLPSNPRTIELDDIVELYTSQYNVPSASHSIIGLELDQLIVEVDPQVPTSTGTIEFSLEKQVPFARIRKSQKNNFEQFKSKLVSWLDASENRVQFFRNLNRFINELTSNSNPTISDVGAAKNQVKQLLGVLTATGATAVGKDPADSLEGILASYQVTVEPRVDTLIDTFRQRGADRAVAVLLEGQFSGFFSLTQSSVSYIGAALELFKEVQREDLPIRKDRRMGVRDQEILIASYEEPDAEFDLSDIQDFDEPDFFGEFTESGDGNAY